MTCHVPYSPSATDLVAFAPSLQNKFKEANNGMSLPALISFPWETSSSVGCSFGCHVPVLLLDALMQVPLDSQDERLHVKEEDTL